MGDYHFIEMGTASFSLDPRGNVDMDYGFLKSYHVTCVDQAAYDSTSNGPQIAPHGPPTSDI